MLKQYVTCETCVMFNICARGLTLQRDYKSFPTKVHTVLERL